MERDTTSHKAVPKGASFVTEFLKPFLPAVLVVAVLVWWGTPSRAILLAGAALTSGCFFLANSRIGRIRADKARQVAERMLSAMSESVNDALVMLDSNDSILFWNDAAERMFGYDTIEAAKLRAGMLLRPSETTGRSNGFTSKDMPMGMTDVMEFIALRKDGDFFPAEGALSSFEIDGVRYSVGCIRDISKRKEQELAIKKQETADPVTGLYNQQGFTEHAQKEITRAQRYNRPLSLLLLDPDGLEAIEMKYGCPAGQTVLKRLAVIGHDVIRANDIIGRMEGGTFAILLPETGSEGAELMADRLRSIIAKASLRAGETFFHITVSIGMVHSHDLVGQDLSSLIAAAGTALAEAKSQGPGTFITRSFPE